MKKSFKIIAVVLALLLLGGTLAFSLITMLSMRAMAQEQQRTTQRLAELEERDPYDPSDPGYEEHASGMTISAPPS